MRAKLETFFNLFLCSFLVRCDRNICFKNIQMNHTTLVELAKSLGIMETIYCDGERPSIDQTCTTFAKEQIYDFLIVIDFEATCWESTEVKWKQPEIIGICCCFSHGWNLQFLFIIICFLQNFLRFY